MASQAESPRGMSQAGCCAANQGGSTPWSHQNVHDTERWGSAILGGGLLLSGLRHPLSLRGWLMGITGGALLYRGVTGHCSMYQALGINTREPYRPMTAVPHDRGKKVEKNIVINRPADELYQFWRKLDNLPKVMDQLVSVETISDTRSHWVAKGILGSTVEWDAEIINDRPGELISWRSIPGGDVDTAGSVRFERRNGSTNLRISIDYSPPADKVGATVANVLQDGLAQKLEEDLHRFKQMMEAGEVSAASPALAGGTGQSPVAPTIQGPVSVKQSATSA